MLREQVNRYIALQQSFGRPFVREKSLLHSFVSFATHKGDQRIRARTVVDWASTNATAQSYRIRRLVVVRYCALALRAEDMRHELPPADAFGREQPKHYRPHIYTSTEIRRLLNAARRLEPLPPLGQLRPATIVTLLCLLVATGLRISEALKLKITDLTDDGLLIRATKFRKTRLVPVHRSTRRALEQYLVMRLQFSPKSEWVFVSRRGARLTHETVYRIFLQLQRSIGMRGGRFTPGPRLHDFRHTFAVRSLEGCENEDSAVTRHILALSTYLGHANAECTYWYLHTFPSLMRKIALVGESYYQGERS